MSSPGTPLHKREWRPGFAIDVAGVLGVVRRGRGDPTFRTTDGGAIWRTSTTPDGAATTVVFRRSDGTVVMQAWGPGAAWSLRSAAHSPERLLRCGPRSALRLGFLARFSAACWKLARVR